MSSNIFKIFNSMIPSTPLMIVTVRAINLLDGTSTVETPDGNRFKVMGTSISLNGIAYIRNQHILGGGPALILSAEQTI